MAAPRIHLYEETIELQTIGDMLLESGGELTPEIEERLAKAEGSFDERAEQIVLHARELEVSAAAIRGRANALRIEPDRLDKHADGYERAADRLLGYVFDMMVKAKRPLVEGKLVQLKLQKNPPAVKGELTSEQLAALVTDSRFVHQIERVPASYKLLKAMVIEAWKRGAAIPGGLTVQQATRLVIK